MQLVLFFNVICLACYALLFFFGCDNIKMAGATMPYFNSGENLDLVDLVGFNLLYRVTITLVQNLPLTSNQKFRFGLAKAELLF